MKGILCAVCMCVNCYVYTTRQCRKRPLVSGVEDGSDPGDGGSFVLVIVEDLAGSSGKNLLTARVDPTKSFPGGEGNSHKGARQDRARRHLTRPNRDLAAEFGLN